MHFVLSGTFCACFPKHVVFIDLNNLCYDGDCVKVFFSTKWFRLMLFQFNQIMLRSFEVKVFLMPFCVSL